MTAQASVQVPSFSQAEAQTTAELFAALDDTVVTAPPGPACLALTRHTTSRRPETRWC
jgi:hypothetical protein